MKYLRGILLCILSVLLLTGQARAETSDEPYFFSAFYDNPKAVLYLIKEDQKGPPFRKPLQGKIRAGILPHHLLAHGMMVDFFETLTQHTKPNRIILIGPDHHGRGLNFISVSSMDWKSPFGIIPSDKALISQLQSGLKLLPDDQVFNGEHSIANVMTFIGYYFPETTVVPILLQPKTPSERVEMLAEELRPYLKDPGTLILLSIDFTHHATSEVADEHDVLTERAISRADVRAIDRLDVDCPAGLYLMLLLAREDGWTPAILDHSNGAKILKNADMKEITSYFTVLFTSFRN